MLRLAVPVLALALTAAPARAQEADIGPRLDRFIEGAMAELGVPPGLAIAVVRGDETLHLRGFGYRDVEARLPVEPETVFYIASSTKSFTGLTAAVLAARGEIDLDWPFSRLIPEARLPADAGGLPPVTLRDLLTHSAGLENFGIVFRTAYSGQHDAAGLVALIERSEPGERAFEYDNIGYVLASLALERATGRSWKTLLDEEVLRPLGLRRTTASVRRAEIGGWPIAAPYGGSPDGFERIPFVKTDATMHAAGGLLSTAADLAVWLRAHLGQGRLNGRQVLPADAFREAHRCAVPVEAEFERFRRTGYGLGWYCAEWEGERMLHHFGSFSGARAHVSFLPAHGVGVAVLINDDGHGFLLPDLIARYAYESLLGRPDVEVRFAREIEAFAETMRADMEEQRSARLERAARAPSLGRGTEAYVGTYENPDLGTLVIERRPEGQLAGRIGALEGILGPGSEAETARFEPVPGMAAEIAFSAGEDRVVRELTLFQRPWRRVADPALRP